MSAHSKISNKSIAAGPAPDPKNMRGLNFRIELDVISASAPDVAGIAQKVVHLIGVVFHFAKFVDRHIDIGILFAVWIEINDHQYDVVAGRGHFPLKQNGFVVGLIEPQVIVRLKGAIFFPDLI